MKAIISGIVGGLFLMFGILSLPYIIFAPYKFVLFFTLAVICFLVSLAYLNGPQNYVKKNIDKKYRL
jgi:hypothetical protein